jgi:hypothetical protein
MDVFDISMGIDCVNQMYEITNSLSIAWQKNRSVSDDLSGDCSVHMVNPEQVYPAYRPPRSISIRSSMAELVRKLFL